MDSTPPETPTPPPTPAETSEAPKGSLMGRVARVAAEVVLPGPLSAAILDNDRVFDPTYRDNLHQLFVLQGLGAILPMAVHGEAGVALGIGSYLLGKVAESVNRHANPNNLPMGPD